MRTFPETIGHYQVVRHLASGGMGDVLEAVDPTIGRRVAIKLLHTDLTESVTAAARLFNEARAANQLYHPALVQLHAHGQLSDGSAYLVMELLPGNTVRTRLQAAALRGVRLSIDEVLQIGWQAADALAALHSQGVIHRDVKPDNLMLVPDPVAPRGERLKLLDFGIAKLLRNGGSSTLQTGLLGTPRYMAPEQCRSRGTLDGGVDVYALGVVLYELLTGQPPFTAESPEELLAQHLYEEPLPLAAHAPRVPASVACLVHRLLCKSAAERPSMSEVAQRLGALLAEGSSRPAALASLPVEPTVSLPEHHAAATAILSRPTERSPQPRSRQWLAVLTLLCLLVLASASRRAPQPLVSTARVSTPPSTTASGRTPPATTASAGTNLPPPTAQPSTALPAVHKRPQTEVNKPRKRLHPPSRERIYVD